MWLFVNNTKHRQIIYQIEACEEMSWFVLIWGVYGARRGRNPSLKRQSTCLILLQSIFGRSWPPRVGSRPTWIGKTCRATHELEGSWSSVESTAELKWPASYVRPSPLTSIAGESLPRCLGFRDPVISKHWRMQAGKVAGREIIVGCEWS